MKRRVFMTLLLTHVAQKPNTGLMMAIPRTFMPLRREMIVGLAAHSQYRRSTRSATPPRAAA